ncbi:MAG: ATP-binding cassette domain-containing protein [Bacteroidaceae bacterium]|nr:ATP-binding cassette domain-containing protein [Bacteroidaceae bacterium]MBR4967182.1 ATP-binding cassette domain-containing protein [Bacteroidaceae bacterium]MBR5531011.1 ATP-binding cassette domain-containing protein [Bacteroidaceae bacterium]MBR6482012.1 ATP-binding cassette domain-containing protein [Bacteroidaceae bacterium]
MLIQLKDTNICQKDKTVLENIEFHVDENEFVYIIGKVGSGKSSLLKTLYGELPLASGSGEILGFDLRKLKRKHIPDLRKQLGIIFQDFQLLADHTVRENLDFVLRATGWKRKAERSQRIDEVLNLVELPEKIDKYPHELSGGEQQRISIARALLNTPRIILADEPTGNLDQETGKKIVSILKQICEQGTSVIMITHNLNLLQQFPGIVYRCEDKQMSEVTSEYNVPIEIE